jgi:hypothetical protein
MTEINPVSNTTPLPLPPPPRLCMDSSFRDLTSWPPAAGPPTSEADDSLRIWGDPPSPQFTYPQSWIGRLRWAGLSPRDALVCMGLLLARTARSMKEYKEHLHIEGYGLELKGLTPTLVPLDGKPEIRLSGVRLRSTFWLAVARWDDGLAWTHWGHSIPEKFWQALTGHRLTHDESIQVSQLCNHLGIEEMNRAICMTLEKHRHWTRNGRFSRLRACALQMLADRSSVAGAS